MRLTAACWDSSRRRPDVRDTLLRNSIDQRKDLFSTQIWKNIALKLSIIWKFMQLMLQLMLFDVKNSCSNVEQTCWQNDELIIVVIVFVSTLHWTWSQLWSHLVIFRPCNLIARAFSRCPVHRSTVDSLSVGHGVQLSIQEWKRHQLKPF